MLDMGSVFVWEWLDEQSLWRPYSPQVVHYIENVIRENPRAGSVSLGEADVRLTPYILDLISMNQFRLDSGTLHPVRRMKFPLSSAPGRGVTWEWEESPGYWIPFETRLSVLIQQALERKQSGVRLGEPCSGSHICFKTMTQVNFPSQRRIRVRYRAHKPYPSANSLLGLQTGLNPFLNEHVNHKPGTFISSPYLENSKTELININRERVTYSKEPADSDHMLLNVNHKLVDIESEPVNNGLLNSNYVLTNFNHYLENFNHDQVNTSSRPNLNHFNNGFSSCNPFIQEDNSGLLNFSNGNLNCGLVNTKSELLNPNTVWAHIKPELVTDDSRSANPRPVLVRSDSRPDQSRPKIVRSVSRPEYSGQRLSRSNSRPGSSNPVLLRSDFSTASPKSKMVMSTCNPDDTLIIDSIHGLGQYEARPADFRSLLGVSDFKPADSRADFRSADSKPMLARSNTRSDDFMMGSLYQHSGTAHSKPELANRRLSRSTSVQTRNSTCACPQCLLVQSIKSASWPGIKPEKIQTGRLQTSNRPRETSTCKTRVPPLVLSNIESSGVISPALAGIGGLLMSAAGLPVCLSLPCSPVVQPPPVRKRDIQSVPGILGNSRKISNKKGKKPEEIIKQFMQQVKLPPEEDCTLCLKPLTAGLVGKLYRCSHIHHVQCLAPLYKDGTLRCPSCQTLYGVKMGSQPPGKMSYHLIPHSLPGHPNCKTIRIIYHIPPGIQVSGQPNPGKKFTAPDFPLHCYLPNTAKGREVLRLLIEIWERRLLFPIVPSQVAGVPDSVSTSRIPHKTEFGSNLTGRGFPDPRYLDSVLRQLRDWGITGG
ncbi:E3 ubiquitin-protein ligase DTX4-like [Bombina bombina]|uniref:E3 ubiquitin-protein ligase DTX4-like n=1 Tax=Bombina bombina TaxID=8345 RepID=UPI00235AA9E1|nr:E3 ubiquitin-protein ligase DTX4-like [Bombina bombina]